MDTVQTIGKAKAREEVHTTTVSNRKGMAGWLEATLRRFRFIAFLMTIAPLLVLYPFCIGVSLAPGYFIFNALNDWSAQFSIFGRFFSISAAFGLGFFCFVFTLIFIVPAVNFLLPLKVKPSRGGAFSLETIPWYWHNALTYLVRYTVLELLTPSPLNVLFYRMMGMKIGKGVIINTTCISDPCMITVEDYVTIGGSATIMAHYGMKGYLIISPTVIKKGATIGLRASIMGDVVIGKNAMVKPHGVVLPKSRIEEGATV